MKVLFFQCFLFIFVKCHDEEMAVSRIVGGTDAEPGEFPYQVSIKLKRKNKSDLHFCGGAIYNEKTVITAGHCMRSFRSSSTRNLQVVAGHLKLKIKSEHEQISNVSHIIRHPEYKSNSFLYDIALLEVDPPFVFDSFIAGIPLPFKFQNFSSQDCVVTGWGATKVGSHSGPDVLQKVTVPIVDDETCRANYANRTLQLSDSMICAGEAGKDSCQGDSGGPLACQGLLAGIVSWGYKCAEHGYPGVYTETSYYIDWVVENAAATNASLREEQQ